MGYKERIDMDLLSPQLSLERSIGPLVISANPQILNSLIVFDTILAQKNYSQN